jgi:hypothetical protein
VLGAVYDLPFGKGKLVDITNPVANGIAGGWQVSANITIQSGVPQTLTAGVNQAHTNNPLPDRPSYSGVGNGYSKDRTIQHWYDPASFVLAADGTFGNVGRNTLITPAFQTFDLAIHKQITMPFNENHSLQLRLEAFNVFNHPVWTAPNGNITSNQFGVITATAINMRQLQVGLKYKF